MIGRIIGGNFRVLKLIGTGAMGHVYQAEQLSLGKMVALKLLRNELMGDEKLIKRFELEAKNASSLNHPNSIQIIDFGRDGDLLYIAMELLPGVDLGQLILREGPLPLGAHRPHHGPGAGGAGRGARPGDRPPRPQAGQHHAGLPARRPRLRQGVRLRHRQGADLARGARA